jgi:hypothetical protein
MAPPATSCANSAPQAKSAVTRPLMTWFGAQPKGTAWKPTWNPKSTPDVRGPFQSLPGSSNPPRRCRAQALRVIKVVCIGLAVDCRLTPVQSHATQYCGADCAKLIPKAGGSHLPISPPRNRLGCDAGGGAGGARVSPLPRSQWDHCFTRFTKPAPGPGAHILGRELQVGGLWVGFGVGPGSNALY